MNPSNIAATSKKEIAKEERGLVGPSETLSMMCTY